jgi:hypothetical protein
MDLTHSVWRVPGLHYDPSIKFWTSTTGAATILPGTWGFIWQPPVGTTSAVVYIVSSLDAPPVDARFGLYVHRDITVPVQVNVLGTSEIQGLDGLRGPSAVLLPGANYEWIFYHEDGSSIWGLVSDTAGGAKRLQVAGGALVDITGSPVPTVGQALIASDATHVGFANLPPAVALASTAPLDVGTTAIGGLGTAAHADHVHAHGNQAGGSLHSLAGSGSAGFMSTGNFDKISALSYAYKEPVRAVATTNNTLSGAQTVDGILIGANERILCTAQTTATQNGIWQWSGTSWSRPSDASLSSHWPAGAIVPVAEGSTYADTLWILTTNAPISLGSTSLAFALVSAVPGTIAGAAITPSVGTPGTSFRFARQDHVHAFGAPDPGAMNGFRLSHSATVSVIVDGTYSTIYVTPYKGSKIALWDGTLGVWQIVTIAAASSASLSGHTAGIPVDVFARYTGSGTSLAVDLINWNTATTRSTGLTTQDGVTVRSGGTNSRYLGTFLPASTTTFSHVASASGASSPVCGVWNQDNRIRGPFTWSPAFDSWTIPSADTWQQINAQTSAKIQLVQGQAIDAISARHVAAVNAAGSSASVGIGLDSTTAPTGLRDMSSVSGSLVPVRGDLQQLLATPGIHTLNAIAIATGTAAVFYGAHGAMQGGLTAELWY